MSKLIKVDAIAEQCCCSICNGYLSCGPIRVLPDGSTICGRCTPANPDVSVYRDLAFENVLGMVTFPCRFRQHGCSERALFGQISGHESKCRYQSFACPASCSWIGVGLKLFDHFMEEHSELIKEKAEIKVHIAKSAEDVLLVVKGTITFIIKYHYDCIGSNLRYDIRYLGNHTKYDVSFKINLINESEPECNVNLKPKKCLVFDDSFYDVQKAVILNLNKFSENLDNPDCIVISIILKVIQTAANVHQSVDLLKCAKCCHYLIPPLFDLEENVVCCDCGKNDSNCTLSNNEELLQLVSEIKFPCRWRNCDFIGKTDIYKAHELSCKFYMHKCVFAHCEHSFILSDAVEHYQTHDAEYMANKIALQTVSSGVQHAFTIKNNTIVFLQLKLANLCSCNAHEITIFSTNPDIITGSVNLEHQHCTLKPKPFNFVSNEKVYVKLNQLPSCFEEDDEFTFTVTPD